MIRHGLGGLLLSLLLSAGASAQERTVWRVGEFDLSSAEFGTDDAPRGVAFAIPASGPKEWGATQRAVPPGKATDAAPRRIRFALPDAPRGAYRLRLGLIVLSARLPVVEAEVNGHRGLFHQRFEDYREGNHEGAIFPQYATGSLDVDIPAEFLRRGANEIALTALTDRLSTALPGGDSTADAVLTYDALALLNDPGARPATAGVVSAKATPTVFYRRDAGGRLAEIVSVVVRWRGLAPKGEVTLRLLGGWRATQLLSSERDFGEERFEFAVPAFAAEAYASISVEANGRSYRFTQRLSPARKWTVFLVPHEHLDVGYSDFQTKLAELHSRVIDEALAMTEKYPEFRFSLDGYWQAQQFLEGRTEVEKERFYAAVRDRKIFVPAQHSVVLTGSATAEALLRSFYASHKFNREHGGAGDYVNITDVPSYSWSYASLLAASGLKYFSAAANADRGPTLMLGDLHRHSPFWWEGPDGGRVLMWYARHYHQIGSEFGLPPAVANGYEGLASFLHVYDRLDYSSDAVMLHGSQWENTSLYPQQAAIARDWNKLFAYPELKFAGFGEAIGAIAARAKNKLPVVRGDGGPYWEDGVASDALYAAMERENERRAASAEKLATVASLVDRRFAAPKSVLDRMWDDISLMNEHTWGWGRSVTEPHSEDSTRELAWKRLRAVTARDSVDYVADRALTAIAGQIKTPTRALVVFNSLNWERDGWVEFDLQKTRELVDVETHQVVRFDVLKDEPAYQRIRFLARKVPAVGYRTYDVRDKAAVAHATPPPGIEKATQQGAATEPGAAPAEKTDAGQEGDDAQTSPAAARAPRANALENAYYRVALDPASGAIKSIYDKELKQELVDAASPYRFNEYVYVTGGDEFPNQLLTYRKWSPVARLDVHTAEGGRVVSITKSPFGTVAKLESRAMNTPRVETEIVLRDGEKKIEITNRVRKDEVYRKEGIYFAFPVAVKAPRFTYEVQNGVVDPARDMIPGANLEWFSAQNWITVGEPGVAVGIVCKDSFLWTFGDVVRGTWPTEFKAKSATPFAYVMNNYWNTNYVAAQGGDFTFRFTVTSAATLDSAALSRMGWGETTPLERVLIKSQDKAAPGGEPLPAAKMSFLGVDAPDVLLSAWKRAETGEGTVLRFIELGGRGARAVRVSSPLFGSFLKHTCNAVEDCEEAGAGSEGGFNFNTGLRQILTFKLTQTQTRK